jgi:hypothetical protein
MSFLISARIAFAVPHQHADPPHSAGLLPARRERPRRCGPEPRDELPPFYHSIT